MNTHKSEKFNTRTEVSSGANVVHLSGELDLSVAPDFRLVMEPLVGESEKDLIMNLKELKYIDSTGIGILLSILKTRHAAGSKFYVEEVPSQIQKLFDMTGIAKFFTTQENSQ
ncbi:STAS domain-containing protein [Paenibacillus massiliensis]|uniref:STAS domain-containing protein n=1 Tax=Paenibacillus massiliensis TaxID=225917 RepID=UPI00035FC6B4|nr:STAS domain-containing protein [Paenibacillus massiliensis]